MAEKISLFCIPLVFGQCLVWLLSLFYIPLLFFFDRAGPTHRAEGAAQARHDSRAGVDGR